MDKVIATTGFKGSFGEFLMFLRTDPRFSYTNADDLLRGYRDICKRADPELARLFGKLPRLPYGVLPIPDYAAKSQTTAYYQPGSPPAGRPGYFYANTYAVETRPKWEMEALTLHESVPGHHLQIALAQEMDDVPEFRKHGSYTAFVEGWGLYAESLGTEMGFYQDPYAKFGQLIYEMWRAIRLVVDTGMHAKGWTRQQAIDYFLANASKNEHDVTVEVDRYIVWPGQALAYKIGELKIKELRAYATQELGDQFDIRQFHDQVLGNAAVPLDILEARIKEWVKRRRREEAISAKRPKARNSPPSLPCERNTELRQACRRRLSWPILVRLNSGYNFLAILHGSVRASARENQNDHITQTSFGHIVSGSGRHRRVRSNLETHRPHETEPARLDHAAGRIWRAAAGGESGLLPESGHGASPRPCGGRFSPLGSGSGLTGLVRLAGWPRPAELAVVPGFRAGHGRWHQQSD